MLPLTRTWASSRMLCVPGSARARPKRAGWTGGPPPSSPDIPRQACDVCGADARGTSLSSLHLRVSWCCPAQQRPGLLPRETYAVLRHRLEVTLLHQKIRNVKPPPTAAVSAEQTTESGTSTRQGRGRTPGKSGLGGGACSRRHGPGPARRPLHSVPP